MTPEQLREAAAVMLAAADGKVIQYCTRGTQAWGDANNPEHRYDFRSYAYRIKPEPRKVRVQLFKSQHGEIEPFRVDSTVGRVCMPISDIVEIEVRDE